MVLGILHAPAVIAARESRPSCRIAHRVATLLLAASHRGYIVEMAFRAPIVAVNSTLHETGTKLGKKPGKKPKANS